MSKHILRIKDNYIKFSLFSLISLSLLQPAWADKSYLFVEHAKTIEIQSIGQNLYKLKLNNVKPRLMYFTDRPNRVMGRVSLQNFLIDWKKGENSFLIDPPNAVIDGESNGHEVSYIFNLKNPMFDKKNNSLTYEATALTNQVYKVPGKQTVEYPSLFIDSGGVCFGCGGGGF